MRRLLRPTSTVKHFVSRLPRAPLVDYAAVCFARQQAGGLVTSRNPHRSGRELLQRTYTALGLDNGRLLKPADRPTSQDSESDWRAVGDWLTLASRMNADRVFFVGDDPILVFSVMPDGTSEKDLIRLYRQAWSLSRPRCLFIASDNEIRVYALSAPPPSTAEQWNSLAPLQVIERTADLADALQQFRRDRIEAGLTFENESVGISTGQRADQQLVGDIAKVARSLKSRGLPAHIAHGLIERVVLVRYLEDRSVVTSDYLQQISSERSDWVTAISSPPQRLVETSSSSFISCLNSKSLTYAVFAALEREFNGDLFIVSTGEQEVVTEEHLLLLQRLLTRNVDDEQEPLFLWAYDFSVVPTSLISSMYEHFYHLGESGDERSTHYTPPELVEYIVADILTAERLDGDPKVCDPACGSGVFLVEAYRRIVRHEMSKRGRRLTIAQLRHLLLSRIAGIDLNAEAVRLAAFSLYLAFLNYQTAKDIRDAGPLPRLIHTGDSRQSYDVLVVSDAFAPTLTEAAEQLFDTSSEALPTLPWPNHNFDILIGNPPWDEPKGEVRLTLAERWARKRELPVGDRSPSQLFLWRSLTLMKQDGIAGLLVASSVFHNSRPTTRSFRSSWLSSVNLAEVINFSQARHIFFAGAIAPFFFVEYHHRSVSDDTNVVVYSTLRPSVALVATRSLVYAQVERRLVGQNALSRREYLWKVYAWGSNHDEALMSRLDLEPTIKDWLPDNVVTGYGYQRGPNEPSETLTSLPSLRRFLPWGRVHRSWLEPSPVGVKRQPDERLYRGRRLLIRRGITTGFGPWVRLEEDDLTFRHHTYSISLSGIATWQAELIFGVLLSSVGRYRIFMTSGSWGIWHDSALSSDILRVPIPRQHEDSEVVVRCLNLVRQIRVWQPLVEGMLDLGFASEEPDTDFASRPTELLHALDEAVYDLFEFSRSERDIVEDWLRYRLPETTDKPITRRIRASHLSGEAHPRARLREASQPLFTYIDTFVSQWNAELAPEGELAWQVVQDIGTPILAAIFEIRGRSLGQIPVLIDPSIEESDRWRSVLSRLQSGLRNKIAHRVATDGVVRAVGDDFIVIIKRDEERLWSPSAAREDFEATLVQAMNIYAA